MSGFMEETANRLFAGEVDKKLLEQVEQGHFPQALWAQVCSAGFTRLFCAEAQGGIEADWADAYELMFALGYHQVPAPISETAIAYLLASAAGLSLDSDQPVSICSSDDSDVRMDQTGATCLLSGSLRAVKWARHASHVLLSLPDGQLAVIDLSAAGVSVEEGSDMSGMPANRVRLDAVAVSPVANPFPDLTDPVRTLGAGARAMMMVGALEFALDQSVQYAKDRVQFGKPIGKNQAIQQQLAAMAGEVALARAAAFTAAKDMPSLQRRSAPSAEFSVAAAKVCAGEAVTVGAGIAHQVHGAIGFTYEHALNFATRRMWAWRGDFRNAAWWAQRLGTAFVQKGAQQFWPHLVTRTLPV